jgi:hypothetical protein
VPRRTKAAPTPFGAPILWPETVAKSNGIFRASMSIFPNA